MRRAAAALAVSAAIALGASCDDSPAVLVIGHRGAPLEELENSIASFSRAKALGADGVELDVQLTADGRLVVMHDPTLDRTTTCTGAIRARSLAELGACSLQNGEPIRTLEQVLEIIVPLFSLVFVEIKVDEPVDQEKKADEAARVVLSRGFAEKVVFTSYDEKVNRRLATRRAEGVHAAWDDFTNVSISRAARVGLDWVLIRLDGIEGREGTIVRGLDKRLCVYGITTPAHFVKAQNAGVDVMMTDSIRVVLALANRKPPPIEAGRSDAPGPDGGQ